MSESDDGVNKKAGWMVSTPGSEDCVQRRQRWHGISCRRRDVEGIAGARGRIASRKVADSI